MDDGMQFVKSEKIERTAPQYVVAATSKRGELIIVSFCGTENRKEALRWMEEAEAKNSEWLGHSNYHLRVFLPEHQYMDDAIEEIVEVEAAIETSEVVEQSVKAPIASTNVTYMTYNKSASRYEAEIDSKIYCVNEEAFADRFYAACKATPTDDEYRIWGVLTWLSSWNFSGKQSGAYIIGVVS